ncbi:hypothetical protein [Streptomyces coerulescens]|uniref:Transcriptional regulator n=1 Tax=Streptomyces coerulescens TaxID=29304 RepID=A0ABW0CY92_STRCD
MESAPPLSETLRRLELLIRERGLNRSDVLNPQVLAAETALPEEFVHLLLQGRPVPEETVNERVCTRLKAVAEAHMARTRTRPAELVADLHRRLGISEYWARQICDGKKVPNIDLLHRLVRYFGITAGEPFFTDGADEALNRVLLPIQRRLEPEGDSLDALLARHGVVQTDLRMHGSLNPEQRKLLAGVLLSVLSQEGDTKQ